MNDLEDASPPEVRLFAMPWAAKVYGGYHQTQPALAHQCAHPGLLHQLLHAFAERTRRLAARRGPVGLPCECFAF
jgi:hypothetical protein